MAVVPVVHAKVTLVLVSLVLGAGVVSNGCTTGMLYVADETALLV
jgi:hypothetical protein